MSGFRYCDADEAARLNAPAATPETPSLTLSGAQRRTIAGGIHFALGVLARMGTTKDFRLANAIRSARVELTAAHAIIAPSPAPSGRLPAGESEGASKEDGAKQNTSSPNPGGEFLPPAGDGAGRAAGG